MRSDALLCAESHPGRSPEEPASLSGTVITSNATCQHQWKACSATHARGCPSVSLLLSHLSQFIQHGHCICITDQCTSSDSPLMTPVLQANHLSASCCCARSSSRPPVDISKLWPSVPFTVLCFLAVLEVTYISQIHGWCALVHGTTLSAYQKAYSQSKGSRMVCTFIVVDIDEAPVALAYVNTAVLQGHSSRHY